MGAPLHSVQVQSRIKYSYRIAWQTLQMINDPQLGQALQNIIGYRLMNRAVGYLLPQSSLLLRSTVRVHTGECYYHETTGFYCPIWFEYWLSVELMT